MISLRSDKTNDDISQISDYFWKLVLLGKHIRKTSGETECSINLYGWWFHGSYRKYR